MEKIAIIGTGIAGMGCAHLLKDQYDLTIYEQNDYIGGHTNTITVAEGDDKVHMDTGFMVFNYETYPHLTGLFKKLKAPVKKSDMSFSVQYVPAKLEYCGSGISGLFAQKKNIFNWSHIRMLLQISRFNEEAIRIISNPAYENHSLKDFIDEFGFSEDMLWKYLIPMSAAVWSAPMESMLDFPAVTLIRFFKNHGFLGLDTQHQWYTLHNGSQSYKELLIKPFKDRIRVGDAVLKVERRAGKAVVYAQKSEPESFDKVIIASHADQALNMLAHPTESEKQLLKAFKYQKNVATVHTDESVMPVVRKAWSSWNYKVEEKDGRLIATTIYWMNRLQGVSENKNYFVSVNPVPGSLDPSKVIREIDYEHPLFDVAAVQAQKELHTLNENGPIYFCGSYFRYGFHEDAYASAVQLCKILKNEQLFV